MTSDAPRRMAVVQASIATRSVFVQRLARNCAASRMSARIASCLFTADRGNGPTSSAVLHHWTYDRQDSANKSALPRTLQRAAQGLGRVSRR